MNPVMIASSFLENDIAPSQAGSYSAVPTGNNLSLGQGSSIADISMEESGLDTVLPLANTPTDNVICEQAMHDRTITDAYIRAICILPCEKNGGKTKFATHIFGNSVHDMAHDHTPASCPTVRKPQNAVCQRKKKKVPKETICPVSVMSMTDLDAVIAEVNKLPSPAYQAPKHVPKPLRQQGISSEPVVINVPVCAYLLAGAISTVLLANDLPMLVSIFGALAALPISMLHVYNYFLSGATFKSNSDVHKPSLLEVADKQVATILSDEGCSMSRCRESLCDNSYNEQKAK